MLPTDYLSSVKPESEKHTRHLLTLLMETEKIIQCDPDIASVYLSKAIALLEVRTSSGTTQDKKRGELAQWQVKRIDEFIDDHLHQCIRISELASLLGLSVSHFTHSFKQTTGVTPLAYVAAVRVKAARQRMLYSTNSLTEIALMHGFCDQSHFSRVFRRETGLAPQAWRQLHASNA